MHEDRLGYIDHRNKTLGAASRKASQKSRLQLVSKPIDLKAESKLAQPPYMLSPFTRLSINIADIRVLDFIYTLKLAEQDTQPKRRVEKVQRAFLDELRRYGIQDFGLALRYQSPEYSRDVSYYWNIGGSEQRFKDEYLARGWMRSDPIVDILVTEFNKQAISERNPFIFIWPEMQDEAFLEALNFHQKQHEDWYWKQSHGVSGASIIIPDPFGWSPRRLITSFSTFSHISRESWLETLRKHQQYIADISHVFYQHIMLSEYFDEYLRSRSSEGMREAIRVHGFMKKRAMALQSAYKEMHNTRSIYFYLVPTPEIYHVLTPVVQEIRSKIQERNISYSDARVIAEDMRGAVLRCMEVPEKAAAIFAALSADVRNHIIRTLKANEEPELEQADSNPLVGAADEVSGSVPQAQHVERLPSTTPQDNADISALPLKLPEVAPRLYKDRNRKEEKNIVDFLRNVWAPWMKARLLTRQKLGELDKGAYDAVANWLKKQPLPEDFYLPTKREVTDIELAQFANSSDRPVRLDWAIKRRGERQKRTHRN